MPERQFELDKARARLLQQLRRTIADEVVLEAMGRVPRHLFVPEELRSQAYEDRPLPIGVGQTISQPSIVALMTQALRAEKGDVVLEVGTGSGYQTAIAAELAGLIISVERIPSLAGKAREVLEALGYRNVEIHIAGSTLGYNQRAPYDRVLVTAAAPYVPQSLLDQLKEGGRMVIPVGSRWNQDLIVVTKQGERIFREALTPCRFVPLVGEEAWGPER